MQLKMESTVSEKMVAKNIFPSSVPPVKIKVKNQKKKDFSKDYGSRGQAHHVPDLPGCLWDFPDGNCRCCQADQHPMGGGRLLSQTRQGTHGTQFCDSRQ
jgi:hypothetical protein